MGCVRELGSKRGTKSCLGKRFRTRFCPRLGALESSGQRNHSFHYRKCEMRAENNTKMITKLGFR